MPLQRIKYALAHLSRKEHIALLARPNWRRLRKTDPNVLARPFAVRRAAIRRGRASKRIRVMAQPKFVTKKYDPAAAPPPYPRIHPKTLAARSTKRIVDLALPKRRLLLETMKLAATKNMKATVSDLLLKVRRSRYQRYRVFCNARQEREARKKRKRMAKLRRAFTKPEDWQRHMRVLERLAAPKVAAKPKRRKPTKRRKKRPLNWERLYFLALPQIQRAPKAKDPLEIMSRALTYRITKRIESLAVRRKLPEMPLRIPGAVSPAATKAIGSIEHTHYKRYHRDPSASISSLDARRNRRHRSPAEAATFSSSPILVAYIGSPHQYCYQYYWMSRIVSQEHKRALESQASKRIIALAKPAQRPAGRETDLREDAFTVSPAALKARCTKRLKSLAKPKTYPKPKFKRLRTALKR